MEEHLNEALMAERDLSDRQIVELLRTLRELGANQLDGIVTPVWLRSRNPEIANEAVLALASSRNPIAPQFLLKKFWNDLTDAQRRTALTTLAGSKHGATEIVDAAQHGTIEKADFDSALLDKLHAVIPDNPELGKLVDQMSSSFRPALRLNGKEDAWLDSKITLDGPFTVETWAQPCALCGATGVFLDEIVVDDKGGRMFVCSDTDFCGRRRATDGRPRS